MMDYVDNANWKLICNSTTPARFGELESGNEKSIYIHATGYNVDGTINITSDIK